MLLVDDSEDNRLVVSAFLGREPLDIEERADGQSAVTYLNEHHADLKEWPYLLIGGCGGRLKLGGRYLRYPGYGKRGHRTIGNWYTTLLNAHGNPIEHYGNLDLTLAKNGIPQTGPLRELM